MRDYSNMPVLDWNEAGAPQKARAQILHQEPVILQMPDSVRFDLKDYDFGCEIQEETGILYNCEGGDVLKQLARDMHLEELNTIADACVESSSRVDIDPADRRIIVHD